MVQKPIIYNSELEYSTLLIKFIEQTTKTSHCSKSPSIAFAIFTHFYC